MLHTSEYPTHRVTVTAATAVQRGQLLDCSSGELATAFSPLVGVALTDAAQGAPVAVAVDGEVSVQISGGIRYTGTAAGEYAYNPDSTDLYLSVGTDSAAVSAGTNPASAFAYAAPESWAAPVTAGVATQFVKAVII